MRNYGARPLASPGSNHQLGGGNTEMIFLMIIDHECKLSDLTLGPWTYHKMTKKSTFLHRSHFSLIIIGLTFDHVLWLAASTEIENYGLTADVAADTWIIKDAYRENANYWSDNWTILMLQHILIGVEKIRKGVTDVSFNDFVPHFEK